VVYLSVKKSNGGLILNRYCPPGIGYITVMWAGSTGLGRFRVSKTLHRYKLMVVQAYSLFLSGTLNGMRSDNVHGYETSDMCYRPALYPHG